MSLCSACDLSTEAADVLPARTVLRLYQDMLGGRKVPAAMLKKKKKKKKKPFAALRSLRATENEKSTLLTPCFLIAISKHSFAMIALASLGIMQPYPRVSLDDTECQATDLGQLAVRCLCGVWTGCPVMALVLAVILALSRVQYVCMSM
jgi:hypothetical protein